MSTIILKRHSGNLLILGFIIFAFCINSSVLTAQTLRQLSVKDGLPSTKVYKAFEDSLGFIWFATNNGVVKYDGYEFKNIDFKSVGASNDIWEIYDDEEGTIWFSGEKKLVYLQNDSLHTIPFPESFESSLLAYHHVDNNGKHAVYFDNNLFFVEKNKNDKPRLVHPYPNELSLSFVKEDNNGVSWYIKRVSGCIFLYKSYGGLLGEAIDSTKIFQPSRYCSPHPVMTADNNYYIVVENGVHRINFEKGKFEATTILPKDIKINHSVIQSKNISKLKTNQGVFYLDKNFNLIEDLDFVKDIEFDIAYEDSKKNIWLCSANQGVFFLNQTHRSIQKIAKDITGAKLANIENMATDKQGNIWLTNNSNTIWKLTTNNEAVPYDLSKYIEKKGSVFRYIEFDKYGNLYLGSSQSTCLIIAQEVVQKGRFEQKMEFWPTVVDTTIDLKKNSVVHVEVEHLKHISETSNKNFIIGNSVFICSPHNKYLIDKKRINSDRNYAGTIWRNHLVSGRINGLLFSPLNKEVAPIQLQLNVSAKTLFADRKDHLWIGTKNNGLYKYDGQHLDSIIEVQQLKLRISDIIQAENNYWLSTNKGLARISIQQQQPLVYDFQLFTDEDGLIASQINQCLLNNNQLYLATQKGINIVSLHQLNTQKKQRPLFFTGVSLDGEELAIHELGDNTSEYLKLKHDISNIKIQFTCLPYAGEEYVYYEYRTKGIQEQWQAVSDNIKEFNINTLKPGKYTFEVRAKNANGIISETQSLNFQIIPSWWTTWWTQTLFFLAIAATLYFTLLQIFKRKKIQAENQALTSISQAKTNFFTNITHELRTPLTMIMGISQLEDSDVPIKSLFLDLKIHTKTMLQLINQLLDISRLEAGALPVHLETGDLVQFCKNTIAAFSRSAEEKQQGLHFYTNTTSLNIPLDSDKLERILYNILANAIKYTQESGTINVTLKIPNDQSHFSIAIADNGPGIEQELINSIFNKYTKTNDKKVVNSSGIGLYLAQELSKLLGGNIQVVSSSKGSTFTLTIPITVTDTSETLSDIVFELPISKSHYNNSLIKEFPLHTQENLPTLLLVDDSPDILKLLRIILLGKYNICVANNGREGLNLAIEIVPELIISDIMMPEVDGLELYERLKANFKTSHIPFILLSAKNTKEDQIKGISLGADAYITKPFDRIQLLKTIETLLINRKQMRSKYANLGMIGEENINNAEDQFIIRIKTIIEENLSNKEFNVNTLCTEMFMSRTQLYNKLKYTTGLGAGRFIRNIRLEKARKLLTYSNLKIINIAHEVGMESKYFSRTFHQAYGTTPTAYRKLSTPK